MAFEWFGMRSEALLWEERAIRTELPKYNIRHRPGSHQRDRGHREPSTVDASDIDVFEWLNPRYTAHRLGVSQVELARWRDRGLGPRYRERAPQLRSQIRYRLRDIEAWGEACRKDTAA
jgi:hypothetical protein